MNLLMMGLQRAERDWRGDRCGRGRVKHAARAADRRCSQRLDPVEGVRAHGHAVEGATEGVANREIEAAAFQARGGTGEEQQSLVDLIQIQVGLYPRMVGAAALTRENHFQGLALITSSQDTL